jgi:hypothetical protein
VRRAVRSTTVTDAVVRAWAVAVALAAGLLLAWPAGPALAAPASTRPAAAAGHVPERFHLTSGDPNSSRQHVQAAGVFTARGYARVGDFASGHAVSRLVFHRGAMRLVTKATQRSASVPDASTCKFTEVFSGDYVIRGGTARYRHASGSGTYVTRIFGKLKKARGGGCGTRLVSFWQSTRTRGSLHR